MSRSTLVDVETADSLSATIARKIAVPQEMVLPFTDYTDVLTELFSLTTTVESRVIAAGCVSPASAAMNSSMGRKVRSLSQRM